MSTWWLVESSPAVAHVRAAHVLQDPVWVSTSPRLLDELAARGERTFCPERAEADAEADALGLAGYALARDFTPRLDAVCAWRNGISLAPLFANTLGQAFFITFAKGLFLSRALEAARAEGAGLNCVGDSADPALPGLSLHYGRFDTLFAWLARAAGLPGLGVEPHALDPGLVRDKERAVVARRPGRLERLLVQVNAGPATIAYKLWKALRGRGLAPRILALKPWGGRPVAVFRDCELVEESFWGLLRRGARLSQLPELPLIAGAPAAAGDLPDCEALRTEFLAAVDAHLGASGVEPRPLYPACAAALADRLLLALERLRRGLPDLVSRCDAILDRLRPDTLIIGNTLWLPEERLFHQRCQAKGVPFAAFEHGITKGLSAWSDTVAAFDGMHCAEAGVYHSDCSVAAMRAHNPGQAMLVAGASPAMARTALRPLQRRLARRLLGLSPEDRVVLFLPDAESNNFAFGPHGQNDRQFAASTRAVARHLAEAFPDWKVVVKLYPTMRYFDSCDFADLAREFPNIRLAGGVEFRAVRAAADLLAVVSAQSTLGWALGSGAPVLFYEFAWWPSRVAGLALGAPDVPGLCRVVLADPLQHMAPYDPTVLGELLAFRPAPGGAA